MRNEERTGRDAVRVGRNARRFDVAAFIEAWERCDSISEVAGILGISYVAARNRAQALRRDGEPLREMPHGPKGTGPTGRCWTAEECRVDPEELSRLVAAFGIRGSGRGV